MRFSISSASESKRGAMETREREKDSFEGKEAHVCGGGKAGRREGKGSEKEVNDEAEEEAEGGRCESSALTSGFDARP